MTSTVATISTAYDCYQLVEDYFPVSVDYFLREVLRKAYHKGKDIPFGEVLNPKEIVSLPNLFDNEKCISQFSLLHHISDAEVFENNIMEKMGLKKDVKLSIYDMAVWLFHDLQANYLINQQND